MLRDGGLRQGSGTGPSAKHDTAHTCHGRRAPRGISRCQVSGLLRRLRRAAATWGAQAVLARALVRQAGPPPWAQPRQARAAPPAARRASPMRRRGTHGTRGGPHRQRHRPGPARPSRREPRLPRRPRWRRAPRARGCDGPGVAAPQTPSRAPLRGHSKAPLRPRGRATASTAAEERPPGGPTIAACPHLTCAPAIPGPAGAFPVLTRALYVFSRNMAA